VVVGAVVVVVDAVVEVVEAAVDGVAATSVVRGLEETGRGAVSSAPQAETTRSRSIRIDAHRNVLLMVPGYRGLVACVARGRPRLYSLVHEMPELPDIEVYREALVARVQGHRLVGLRLKSPFLLRTVDPPPEDVVGRRVLDVERLGKRLVLCFDSHLFVVLHLMVAGRLQWKAPGADIPRSSGLASFDFSTGSLIVTEAGSRRRASLHIVSGRRALEELDRGGLEVIGSSYDAFAAVLRRENHTLKRALTDPTILSGIGNAYSDEILHRARLSPFARTENLADEQMGRLHEASVATLEEWIARLREESGEGFPKGVTAFRREMSVHGRHGRLCPVCGTRIERVVKAGNECNYCPGCQTGGRILADRALSRLLKDDWPPKR